MPHIWNVTGWTGSISEIRRRPRIPPPQRAPRSRGRRPKWPNKSVTFRPIGGRQSFNMLRTRSSWLVVCLLVAPAWFGAAASLAADGAAASAYEKAPIQHIMEQMTGHAWSDNRFLYPPIKLLLLLPLGSLPYLTALLLWLALPLIGLYTKWNWSAVPRMPVPSACTVHVRVASSY